MDPGFRVLLRANKVWEKAYMMQKDRKMVMDNVIKPWFICAFCYKTNITIEQINYKIIPVELFQALPLPFPYAF